MMHFQAFFVAPAGVHIPISHEIYRETFFPLPCFGEPLCDIVHWMLYVVITGT